MKNYLSIIIGAGLAITSCAVNEIEDNIPANKAESVYASTEAETKTSIGSYEDGIYKIFWTEGDQILIADSKGNNAVYTAVSGGSTTAEFIPENGADEIDFAGGIIAGYPEKDMYISSEGPGKEIYFTIPETQEYQEGSFDGNAMPMISEISHENQLNFYNAAGVLKLMVSSASGAEIQTITVLTANGYISGECGYYPESKTYFFDKSMVSKRKVALSCGDGVTVGKEATPFYIVVPHQKYTSLSITVTLTDGTEKTFTMKEGKELDVKRSAVMNIPVSLDGASEPDGPDVTMSLGSMTFKGFNVKIDIRNAEAYFCSMQTKESFYRDLESGAFIESLPYNIKYENIFSYEGSITKFQEEMQDLYLEPGETYILWVVIYDESGEYTKEDIYTLEIKMKSFSPGGSSVIKTEVLEMDYDAVELSVSASGSQFIFCQMRPVDELADLTDQEIIDLLIKPGNKSNRYEKSKEKFRIQGIRPGTELTFVAVAIDVYGKYGELYRENHQTKQLEYNSLAVEIDKDINKVNETGQVTWNVSNGEAVEYIYYLEDASKWNWTNTHMEDYTYVQEQIFLLKKKGQSNYKYHSTTAESVNIGKASGIEWILVVLAVAEDGSCSMADHWLFTY